jgi:hypothetical protein
MNAYQFFLKHAGYSHGPKETPTQGRIRCARALAKNEAAAKRGGFTYAWDVDPTASSADWITAEDDYKGGYSDPWRLWQCCMLDGEGRIVNSLHGIDFGRDGTPWADPYRRVVEAELAGEGMGNEPQGKYRG